MSKSKKTKSKLFGIKEITYDKLFIIIDFYDKQINKVENVGLDDLKAFIFGYSKIHLIINNK